MGALRDGVHDATIMVKTKEAARETLLTPEAYICYNRLRTGAILYENCLFCEEPLISVMNTDRKPEEAS